MSTTKEKERVCDVSCGRMHELAICLDKAGFDANRIQAIINSKDNELARIMYAAITNKSHERFELLNTITVTVPENYNHAYRLDDFGVRYGKRFLYYAEDLKTDANFPNTTVRLTPGRKLSVRVFRIHDQHSVNIDDCLSFLKSQKALLVGAQGASILWEYAFGELPTDKWLLSLDEKEALPLSSGLAMVPYMYRNSSGAGWFQLARGMHEDMFGVIDDDLRLLCFNDAAD